MELLVFCIKPQHLGVKKVKEVKKVKKVKKVKRVKGPPPHKSNRPLQNTGNTRLNFECRINQAGRIRRM